MSLAIPNAIRLRTALSAGGFPGLFVIVPTANTRVSLLAAEEESLTYTTTAYNAFRSHVRVSLPDISVSRPADLVVNCASSFLSRAEEGVRVCNGAGAVRGEVVHDRDVIIHTLETKIYAYLSGPQSLAQSLGKEFKAIRNTDHKVANKWSPCITFYTSLTFIAR